LIPKDFESFVVTILVIYVKWDEGERDRFARGWQNESDSWFLK